MYFNHILDIRDFLSRQLYSQLTSIWY